MRANNVSARTRSSPTAAPSASSAAGSSTTTTRPTSTKIEPRHVEEWIGSILETSKPATAHNRWRGLQRFFNWYADVDDDFRLADAQAPPAAAAEAHAAGPRRSTSCGRCSATCQGSSFEDRRDNALIRVLFDTGARRHEIAALRYSATDPDDRDVDLRRALVHVLGKGGKDNGIAMSDKTLNAVDDYLRARRKHAHADRPWLWLGKRGQLTDSGIAQAIRDRGVRVGIPNLHAHDFRHAATHHELAGGMNEADVMSKRGWDSPAMLRRYAVDHGQRAGDRGEPQARAGRQVVSALEELREWWDHSDDWPPNRLYEAAIAEVLGRGEGLGKPITEAEAYRTVHDLAREWWDESAARRAALAREIATGVPSQNLSPKQKAKVPEIRKVAAEFHRRGAAAPVSVVAARVGISPTTLRKWVALGIVSLELLTGHFRPPTGRTDCARLASRAA